jgi:hypothetical protein
MSSRFISDTLTPEEQKTQMMDEIHRIVEETYPNKCEIDKDEIKGYLLHECSRYKTWTIEKNYLTYMGTKIYHLTVRGRN